MLPPIGALTGERRNFWRRPQRRMISTCGRGRQDTRTACDYGKHVLSPRTVAPHGGLCRLIAMSGKMPRMTLPTQLVLGELIGDPARRIHGFELCAATGQPSGTVYPILA